MCVLGVRCVQCVHNVCGVELPVVMNQHKTINTRNSSHIPHYSDVKGKRKGTCGGYRRNVVAFFVDQAYDGGQRFL